MTIENYFERRIRPIVEDNNKPNGSRSSNGYNNGYNSNSSGYSSNSTSTSSYTTHSNTANSYSNAAPYNSGSRSNAHAQLIDEDQLTRTFQEIVNYINLDDDSEHEEPKAQQPISMFSNGGGNFSRSTLNQHHVHHSLLPEFNSIFGGSKSSFNVAVGSKGETAGSKSATLGKSFLDDDWFPSSGHSGNTSIPSVSSSIPSTPSIHSTHSIVSSIPSIPTSIHSNVIPASSQPIRSAPSHAPGLSRPITPASTIISSSPSSRFNDFYASNNNSNPPPGDYVCKLCNCDGHWMKDCRLYEPRTPAASISSFKSTNSTGSGVSSMSSSNGSGNVTRTLLPPGNYVCRLCNVAGHWIDQCSKFQPKHLEGGIGSNGGSNGSSGNMSTITSSHSHSHSHSTTSLPVMLGPGPTPNYRPPAYLSKPVPSNYICNLCSRPGHWIQQCTEFTPIINHKPNSKY